MANIFSSIADRLNFRASIFGTPPSSGTPDKPIERVGSPPYQGATHRLPLSNWSATFADADAATLLSLPQLRDRSNDLYRNSPAARGTISTLNMGVLGEGLRLSPVIDHEYLGISPEEAENWQKTTLREWLFFCANCDYMQSASFSAIQKVAFNALQLDGDTFALLPWVPTPRTPYDLKVQLIESPRVMNPPSAPTPFVMAGSSIKFASGIERDDNGVPIAVHIRTPHPGSLYQSVNPRWDRVPIYGGATNRRNVIILANRYRIDQSRGEPILAPVLETLRQISRYSESELSAAVINAMLAVFVKRPMSDPANPAGPYQDDPGSRVEEFASGTMFIGAPGEEMNPVSAARPAMQFDPFFAACMKQIGMAVDVPFEILTKYFSSSYTAARASIVQFEKKCNIVRADFADGFNQPVYEAFLEEAILKGRIKAPKFFKDAAIRAAWCGAYWIGPPTGQINEGIEADAASKRIGYGLSTRTIEAAKFGLDYSDVVKQRAAEVALEKEYGWMPVPPAGITVPYPNDGEFNALPPTDGAPDGEPADNGDLGDNSDNPPGRPIDQAN